MVCNWLDDGRVDSEGECNKVQWVSCSGDYNRPTPLCGRRAMAANGSIDDEDRREERSWGGDEGMWANGRPFICLSGAASGHCPSTADAHEAVSRDWRTRGRRRPMDSFMLEFMHIHVF
jgi:hypothetical protein